MQNGKNKPKSFGEEGSEISVQMDLKTADKYINDIGILEQINPADWEAFRDAEWNLKHALKYVQTAKKRAEKKLR